MTPEEEIDPGFKEILEGEFKELLEEAITAVRESWEVHMPVRDWLELFASKEQAICDFLDTHGQDVHPCAPKFAEFTQAVFCITVGAYSLQRLEDQKRIDTAKKTNHPERRARLLEELRRDIRKRFDSDRDSDRYVFGTWYFLGRQADGTFKRTSGHRYSEQALLALLSEPENRLAVTGQMVTPNRIKAYLKDTKNPHLFELHSNILEKQDYESVMATCKAMEECGILHLPYPAIVIRFWLDAMMDNPSYVTQDRPPRQNQAWLTFTALDTLSVVKSLNGTDTLQIGHMPRLMIESIDGRTLGYDNDTGAMFTPQGIVQAEPGAFWVMSFVVAKLVVALASRNSEVERTENTRLATGRNPKPSFVDRVGTIYCSRSLVRAPTITEASGRKLATHLRRGHPHTFRHGIGRAEKKVLFVPPVWVNARDDMPAEPPRNYRVL